jgi:precorrin-4 methylase
MDNENLIEVLRQKKIEVKLLESQMALGQNPIEQRSAIIYVDSNNKIDEVFNQLVSEFSEEDGSYNIPVKVMVTFSIPTSEEIKGTLFDSDN